LVRYS